jgi:hypothetical protein
LRLGAGEPCTNALLNPRTFELRYRSQDTRNESPGGRRGVDALAEGHERDASRLPFVEHQHEMPEVAPKAVEAPADDGSTRCRRMMVTSWSSAGRRSFAPDIPERRLSPQWAISQCNHPSWLRRLEHLANELATIAFIDSRPNPQGD